MNGLAGGVGGPILPIVRHTHIYIYIYIYIYIHTHTHTHTHTRTDNNVRELNAVKVLHTSHC